MVGYQREAPKNTKQTGSVENLGDTFRFKPGPITCFSSLIQVNEDDTFANYALSNTHIVATTLGKHFPAVVKTLGSLDLVYPNLTKDQSDNMNLN